MVVVKWNEQCRKWWGMGFEGRLNKRVLTNLQAWVPQKVEKIEGREAKNAKQVRYKKLGYFKWWVMSDKNWVRGDKWWKKKTKQPLKHSSPSSLSLSSFQTQTPSHTPNFVTLPLTLEHPNLSSFRHRNPPKSLTLTLKHSFFKRPSDTDGHTFRHCFTRGIPLISSPKTLSQNPPLRYCQWSSFKFVFKSTHLK